MNPEAKSCKNCKTPFAIEPEDFVFYEKIKVPAPTLCPLCRQKRRISFRNFKTLYKRASDKSGKPIIAMYPAGSPFTIYTHDEWWADDWDAKQFGREFDFSRPFFEQFRELLSAVPRFGIMNVQSENCVYANMTLESKDCYLVFGCVKDEACAYGHIVWECKDCLDNLYLYKCELCYECVDCLGSYRLFYSQECENCSDGVGLYDCRSCSNCIGCVGLKQKSYYIFNEHAGKEGYEKFLAGHPFRDPATVRLILEKQRELRRRVPQRHFFGSHNTDVSGNHIYHAKNVHASFDVKGGEDAKYAYTAREVIDAYDAGFCAPRIERAYEVLTSSGKDVYFCHLAMNCTDAYYSDNCFNARNIFGCAGLKGGEYCILNKQYPKEEYEVLKARIVEHMRRTGEWGEFFPVALSPFAYNEAIIGEYFPATKEEALGMGFRWKDDIPSTTGQETISNDALPKNPADFSDELLRHVLKCDVCGKNYRLIPKEVGFYRHMGLSLPRECFNCRHARRMKLRTARSLWPGRCAKCQSEFQTSYSPAQQSKLKIYCEPCYQNEAG